MGTYKNTEINYTKSLRIAAEYCNFESFELLKELNVWNEENIGEILMEFYKRLNSNHIESFMKIQNIQEYTFELPRAKACGFLFQCNLLRCFHWKQPGLLRNNFL